VAVALTAGETHELLHDVPRAYGTRADEVLLAALARAVSAWTGDPRVLVEVEGHGREALFADVDLSRTVGWFTTLFPVLLDLRGTGGERDALRAVKEQLRAVPRRGIGYGALRYLADSQALRDPPRPQLRFEYMGRLDPPLPGRSLFALSPEPIGPVRDPSAARSHLVVVGGSVLEGRLELTVGYSEEVHAPATTERLAADILAELRALVRHCRTEGAGGFTPSDFPRARVSQADLDRLTRRLGGARTES
jgi:non-ribosomal peptide synthase protein (TIGR01720 family)